MDDVHRGEPIVLARFQDLVVQGHTGRDHFGHAALDNGLGRFWVFQLVAHGHPVSGPDQFGQVVLERVVGKPASSISAAAPFFRR